MASPNDLPDLNAAEPIVDPQGKASPYFLRYLFDRGGFLSAAEAALADLAAALADLTAALAGKADKVTQIIAGTGLSGGGDLSTDRTLNVSLALNGLTDVTAPTPTLNDVLSWNGAAWVPATSGGTTAVWGSITGTLADQTDLQTALDSKAASSHTHVIADVTNLQTELDGKQALNALLTDIAGLTLSTGDILYYNGMDIVNLGAGTDGQVLTLASGVPSWADASGGGGSTGGGLPLVTGDVPPVLVYEQDGSLIFVENV